MAAFGHKLSYAAGQSGANKNRMHLTHRDRMQDGKVNTISETD